MPPKGPRGAKRAQPGARAARRDIAVLDVAARLRRQQKYLDDLEKDNYGAQMPIDLQAFYKATDATGRKKRARLDLPKRASLNKTLPMILEETGIVQLSPAIPTYLTAAAPPSKDPPIHLCAVCGFLSGYTCVHCGIRFCSLKCKETHSETRCMKFVM